MRSTKGTNNTSEGQLTEFHSKKDDIITALTLRQGQLDTSKYMIISTEHKNIRWNEDEQQK